MKETNSNNSLGILTILKTINYQKILFKINNSNKKIKKISKIKKMLIKLLKKNKTNYHFKIKLIKNKMKMVKKYLFWKIKINK